MAVEIAVGAHFVVGAICIFGQTGHSFRPTSPLK